MTSIFELFKIGIGPSSSHTMGAMRAAREFLLFCKDKGVFAQIARVRAELFGSLALTGHGHATDRAILLGLSGEVADRSEETRLNSSHSSISYAVFCLKKKKKKKYSVFLQRKKINNNFTPTIR